MRKNISMSEDEALKATNSIEPFYKEMKDVRSRQNEIMSGKQFLSIT